MKKRLLLFLTALGTGLFFWKKNKTYSEPIGELPKDFSFHGHRGARGLVPENTIPSFLKCLEYGVTGVEFDVVISKDGEVVVSHEEWFAHKISSKPDGTPITKAEEKSHLIYAMPYERVKQYDCGKRGHPDFPKQVAMPAHKPLLKEVIKAMDAYTKAHKLPRVVYNIEIKTSGLKGDDVLHPKPAEFVEFVHDVVEKMGIEERVIVQSFDRRIVQEMRKLDKDIALSLLVENVHSVEWNLKQLGFIPEYYAPHYQLITKEMVVKTKVKGMKLITWTVNDVKTMRKLIDWGLDIIITDYPNLTKEV